MKTSTLIKLPCLSWIGKLRMACEIFIARRTSNTEESLGGFIERRFGQESLNRLAQPFLGSIFGMDLRHVSLKALFPHWIAMEQKHGSLTRAFLAAKRNPSAVISAGFRSLKGGLSVLTERLSEKAGVEWCQGAAVQSVFQSGSQTWHMTCADGKMYSGDAVCLTVPANRAVPMVEDFLPLIAAKLREQPSRSVFLVNALFRKEDWPENLKGSGVISGLDAAYDLQGASFSSFKFEGRSAENRILVRLFGSPLKASENLKKTDSEVQNQIIDDFLKTTGITTRPIWSETKRYENVLPSYNLNYLTWKKDVEQSLAGIKGFYLAGQSYQPGGLSGCVISAKNTAERMISDLLKEEAQSEDLTAKEVAHVPA
jgi:protoporphyrinogen/coproporphyrinogen III oxidase